MPRYILSIPHPCNNEPYGDLWVQQRGVIEDLGIEIIYYTFSHGPGPETGKCGSTRWRIRCDKDSLMWLLLKIPGSSFRVGE